MNNRIAELLLGNHERWREHEYIFEKEDGLFLPHTYGEFYEDVLRAASHLREAGLYGKKIAIFGPNSYEFMVLDAAVMGYVGCSVMFAEQWMEGDIKHIRKTVDVAAIVYHPSKAEMIASLAASERELSFLCFTEVLEKRGQQEISPYPVDDNTCSKIVFSSGTTGVPKAVMLSQKNMFVNLENLLKRADMTDRDSAYLFLPLSHTYGGLCNFLYSLHTGMQLYLCSDKNKIVEELMEVKPTILSTVPIFLEKLYMASKGGANVSTLLGGRVRIAFCGGAILEQSLRTMMEEAGIKLLNAYGLTETSSLISIEYPGQNGEESVGTVFENQYVRIDEPNEEGVGEVLVKGENIFIGYYGREDYYQSFFTEDGYFRTGDLGYLIGDRLYFKGRKKRVIVGKNARKIYPDEIEAIILDVTKAEACKVFEREDKLCAAIFVTQEMDEESLRENINKHLPKYCHIKVCELMKNSMDVKWK